MIRLAALAAALVALALAYYAANHAKVSREHAWDEPPDGVAPYTWTLAAPGPRYEITLP